jgi:NADPH:quinone reductase-like Zn-dependent oxidoreductase
VKIYATTVNRTDYATVRAKPFFARVITGIFGPRKQIPGTEFAGEIVELGTGVKFFKVGNKVFGFDDQGIRSQAQYLTISEDKALATIPGGITYEQAAASTEGAHYAYSCIKKLKPGSGQKALVNGASGAIGSAAVQLLKYMDVYVTAVVNTDNLELAESLGADKVIDYTVEDFTRDNERYNFVFDAVGKSSFFKCKRLLQKGGIYISSDLGYLYQNICLPLITPVIKPLLGNRKAVSPWPSDTKGNVLLFKRLMEEGRFKAVIDREYPLDDIVAAYKYVGTGQKTGNVVITVAHED